MQRLEFEEWATNLSESMVRELIKLLEDHQLGAKHLSAVAAIFVAKFTGVVLYKTLTAKPALKYTKADAQKFTIDNYAYFKEKVQEAISVAFTTAMTEFTGEQKDFYCQVKPVQDAGSKLPC